MDELDSAILSELTRNARVSLGDLGRSVGLSANAAAARMRKLEAAGIILGYTAVVVSEAARPAAALEVFIDVRLQLTTDSEAFVERLGPFQEVADVIHMTGPYDVLVHAFVSDTRALDLFLRKLKRECGAEQTLTRVALRTGVRR